MAKKKKGGKKGGKGCQYNRNSYARSAKIMGGGPGGLKPGGERGRPKGSTSAVEPGRGKIKRVAELSIIEARARGELPHEFLARVARGEMIDGYQPTFKERQEAASAAAPYFAPKLAQIEQKTEVSFRAVVSAKPLSEDDWLKMHAKIAEVESLRSPLTIEHNTATPTVSGTGTDTGRQETHKGDLGSAARPPEGAD